MSDPKPYGSIIERFRGTEWENPAPPPPPPPRRGRGPALALGLVILLGGATFLGISLTGGSPKPTPVNVPVNPGVTARVPESMKVLDAFWAVAHAKHLSYHLDATGRVDASGSGQSFHESFELSLDVSGDDFSGTINAIGGSGLSDLVRFDGIVYVRQAGKAWRFVVSSDPDLRQVPFAGLDGRIDLAYDAPVTEGSVVLQRLLSTPKYSPSCGRMLAVSGFRFDPDAVTLELFVTADGTPVRSAFSCEVNGDVATGTPQFKGSAKYTYTDFGAKFKIMAPAK